MIVIHNVTIDLQDKGAVPQIVATQDDQYTRDLAIRLMEGASPWTVPEDAAVVIRYCKSDGVGGEYDTLPDGTTAWSAEENVLRLALAPQVLTCPGTVMLSATLIREAEVLSIFSVAISVRPRVQGIFGESQAYYNVAGFLPGPVMAKEGQYLRIARVDERGRVLALEGAAAIAGGPAVEPGEEDIPKVFFGSALPQTKDDAVMSFRYISKTEDIKGYCKTKAQGNSSMSYPKKNQTVKLYKDEACTEKLKVDFKGWGKQNKFCFKANWIDLTHARNVVSARLWGDVVKSRANYEEIPELLRTSPNQGAVDGFPVKVYANGIYQGRYTLNIPKDAWMANMDDELDEHCILCGENYVSGCFRAEANIDESDWTDEVHDTVPASIKNRWNEAIRFVMNSTDDEFVAGIGNYFDVESLIDYYLFGLVTLNNDGFGKNQLYMTYDGMKWYATVYDVDNTFGTYLGYHMDYDFPRERYEDYYASYETRYGNLLYIRLAELFVDAIKARYAELKKGALSVENIINRFERFTDIAPPYLVEEDYAETTANGAFTEIPLKDVSNIQQIRSFVVARYPYIDGYVADQGKDPTILYELPEETVFAGVDSQMIDTGVKLFDEPKSFTILVDATTAETREQNRKIADATFNSAGEYCGGISISTDAWGPTGFYIKGVPNNGAGELTPGIASTERTKIAVVFTDGLLTAAYYKKASDSTVTELSPNENASVRVTHDGPLAIGATNVPSEPFVGTIHSVTVHNYAMTSEEVTAKMIENP